MYHLSVLLVSVCFLCAFGIGEFEERKQFHDWLCQKKPTLSTCASLYTEEKFKKEMLAHNDNNQLEKHSRARAMAATHVKRQTWWRDSGEDDEYEYYLWKKYRREKLRRKLLHERDHSSESIQYHYHNYPQTQYYRPAYYGGYRYPYNGGYGGGYPYYGGGYPYYGGGDYGGSGYGLGNLFSIGGGRQLGISTPIGGFGYSSGFGIGIG